MDDKEKQLFYENLRYVELMQKPQSEWTNDDYSFWQRRNTKPPAPEPPSPWGKGYGPIRVWPRRDNADK